MGEQPPPTPLRNNHPNMQRPTNERAEMTTTHSQELQRQAQSLQVPVQRSTHPQQPSYTASLVSQSSEPEPPVARAPSTSPSIGAAEGRAAGMREVQGPRRRALPEDNELETLPYNTHGLNFRGSKFIDFGDIPDVVLSNDNGPIVEARREFFKDQWWQYSELYPNDFGAAALPSNISHFIRNSPDGEERWKKQRADELEAISFKVRDITPDIVNTSWFKPIMRDHLEDTEVSYTFWVEDRAEQREKWEQVCTRHASVTLLTMSQEHRKAIIHDLKFADALKAKYLQAKYDLDVSGDSRRSRFVSEAFIQSRIAALQGTSPILPFQGEWPEDYPCLERRDPERDELERRELERHQLPPSVRKGMIRGITAVLLGMWAYSSPKIVMKVFGLSPSIIAEDIRLGRLALVLPQSHLQSMIDLLLYNIGEKSLYRSGAVELRACVSILYASWDNDTWDDCNATRFDRKRRDVLKSLPAADKYKSNRQLQAVRLALVYATMVYAFHTRLKAAEEQARARVAWISAGSAGAEAAVSVLVDGPVQGMASLAIRQGQDMLLESASAKLATFKDMFALSKHRFQSQVLNCEKNGNVPFMGDELFADDAEQRQFVGTAKTVFDTLLSELGVQ